MRDMHNTLVNTRGVSPVAIGTTGTGQSSKIVDLAGYNGVEFYISYGSITATGAVFTVTVKDGDATGSLASVADAYLAGTEEAAGVAAAATRTSGVSKNITKRIGYLGSKRYVQVNVKSTATAGTLISVLPVLGHPMSGPVGAGT